MPSEFRTNVRKYLLFQALTNCLLWMPIWVVYLQERGLSLTEIALADAWTLLILAVAEVPTGGIADRYGRRVCLALGAGLIGAGAILFVLSSNLYAVLLAFVPWMVGATLISGADEALVYDSLDAAGRTADFTRVQAQAMTVVQGAQGLASVAGAALAAVTALYVPFLGFALLSLIAAWVALSLREPPRGQSQEHGPVPGLWPTLARAFQLIVQRPLIRYILLYRAAMNTVPFILVFLLLQPYARKVGVPLAWLGVVVFGARLGSMAGSYLGGRIKEGNATLKLSILFLSTVMALITLAWLDSRAGLLLIGVVAALGAAQSPVLSTLLNRQVSGDVRATVLSVQSLLMTLFLLVSDPVAGYSVERWGFYPTYLGMAGVLLVSAAPSLFLWRRCLARAQAESPAAT